MKNIMISLLILIGVVYITPSIGQITFNTKEYTVISTNSYTNPLINLDGTVKNTLNLKTETIEILHTPIPIFINSIYENKTPLVEVEVNTLTIPDPFNYVNPGYVSTCTDWTTIHHDLLYETTINNFYK